ncbi:DUF4197 domain-containing protein [Deminuibacter soli]|uniref:DUF4197 domain-containing protein n=1 Tax=Deminuibacter soli TaxID=2291815 RepID=A0A3E1NI14_9BACT|nr:DUF4197 domain-containing protein [Deminuibacter soli]RFM27585.1 DUF4197 domain-containing protein [Deminuibacter soli]
MKKVLLFTVLSLSTMLLHAQGWKNILKGVTGKDTTKPATTTTTSSSSSSSSGGLGSIIGAITGSGKKDSLSTTDVVSGLKEALNQGVNKGTSKLSAVDGFFKDAAVKILLPPEAQKVEKTLRSVGMGKLVDNAILSMNRAAEDAAKGAAPIFLGAVKQMSITDAWDILRGTDTAATGYLRKTTTSPLTAAFKPVIDTSLKKVDATKYWTALFNEYNKLPMVSKVNPDLSSFVTEKALAGVFYQIALEEKSIRKDPLGQASDLLKKVFSSVTGK